MSETAVCANCGTPLTGRFCSSCGQKAGPHLDLHTVAHEAAHEFLHFDGKILNTMKLLVAKPGALTNEFLAGRRIRYITPLRLYITWSVIFFALAAIFPASSKNIVRIGRTEGGRGGLGASVHAPGEVAEDLQNEKIGEAVMHNLPRTMFLLMPFFALLTWVCFRRQQPFYIGHLYYSIHFHAFVFFILSIYVLLTLAGRPGKFAGGLLFWATAPYHYIALRRVFGGSRKAVFAKGTVVAVLYWIAIAAVLLGIALWVIRR